MTFMKYVGLALLCLAGCGDDQKAPQKPEIDKKGEKVVSELKIEDVTVGTGAEPVAGKPIEVHYTGTLSDGTKFDSSHDRGQPIAYTHGVGQVIQGWDEGLKGMKVGGKRRLTIPPHMGYGAQGAGGVIPPNATLHFDVELVSVG